MLVLCAASSTEHAKVFHSCPENHQGCHGSVLNLKISLTQQCSTVLVVPSSEPKPPKVDLRCSRAASAEMKIRTEPTSSNEANPTIRVDHRTAKKYYEKLEEPGAKPRAVPKATPKASPKPPEETEKPRPAKKAKAAKPKK